MLTGIDVSHFDPDLDYKRAHAEGAAFIVHKATEGAGTDPTYARRAPAIRASGAVPGAYHFLRSSPSAAAQVDHFLSVIGDPAGLLIQLDWELSGSDLAPISVARAWVAEFHRRTSDHPVLIYLPHWVWADHLGSPPGLSTLGPLWASHYLAGSALTLADGARIPASWWAGYGGWPAPTVLQYAGEAGRIAGTGPADLNVFPGDLADLHRLAGNPTQEDDMGLTPDEYNKIVSGSLGDGNELYLWLRGLNDADDPLLKDHYPTELADLEDAGVARVGLKQLADKLDKVSVPQVDAAALAGPLAAALAANPAFVNAMAAATADVLAKRLES
jgi:GH25 family lysozyme M1 (1,4-beta-N-acetylmuramidase)